MLEEITKEKTSADHLLYVSLKYTKTCDVILNLIERWRSLIDLSFDAIIERAMEEEKILELPNSPKQKIEYIRTYFKKENEIQKIIPLYIFFKRIPGLPKSREGEFRKNVNLKIIDGGKEVSINLEMLKDYSEQLENFISVIRHNLTVKK